MPTSNYYDNWLSLWEKNENEKKNARKVIYPEELDWVRTRQDASAALLVAPETGFRTIGTVSMVAEIPEGWHTGSHSHGEEAIYILKGKGLSIIDDRVYNWEEGSCIHVPFGSVHQHFNIGSGPVRYYSAMTPYLESLGLVAKFEQYEDCGETTSKMTSMASGENVDSDAKGRKLVLHAKDAEVTYGGEVPKSAPKTGYSETRAKEMMSGDKTKGHHARRFNMMGSRPDFMGEEIEITGVLCDYPGEHGGKHGHMEAILYVLQGEGYSMIDGEKVPWKQGTCMHVQGPQTIHQHFNTGTIESQYLRTHSGLRKFLQPIVKSKFPYLYFETRK